MTVHRPPHVIYESPLSTIIVFSLIYAAELKDAAIIKTITINGHDLSFK